MGPRDSEVKRQVKKIYEGLMCIPDTNDRNNISLASTKLYELIRIKQVILPIAEIMSIFKYEKPTLFSATKFSLLRNSQLSMLFEITCPYDFSKQRLQDFFNN